MTCLSAICAEAAFGHLIVAALVRRLHYSDDADWPHRSGFDMAVSGRGDFAAVRGGVGLLGDRATTAATQKRPLRITEVCSAIRRDSAAARRNRTQPRSAQHLV